MQTPIYFDGRCFSNNIEIIRDIAETIGIRKMSNAYTKYSWAVTEYGRIQIMIADRSNGVCVAAEYQGDGCVVIMECNDYGRPLEWSDRVLFDTHSHTGEDISKKFAEVVYKNFKAIV